MAKGKGDEICKAETDPDGWTLGGDHSGYQEGCWRQGQSGRGPQAERWRGLGGGGGGLRKEAGLVRPAAGPSPEAEEGKPIKEPQE